MCALRVVRRLGVARKAAMCVNSWNQTIVSKSKCSDKPLINQMKHCNEDPCPAEYVSRSYNLRALNIYAETELLFS
jgi:hypothetical protein